MAVRDLDVSEDALANWKFGSFLLTRPSLPDQRHRPAESDEEEPGPEAVLTPEGDHDKE